MEGRERSGRAKDGAGGGARTEQRESCNLRGAAVFM